MKLDIEFHSIDLPVELMQICGVSAACVYAVLHAASKNEVCKLSKNEISKFTGLKFTAIKDALRKLETLDIIERQYNPGYVTIYHVKNILEQTEQPEPELKQDKVAAPAEVPAEQIEPARQSEQQPAEQPKHKRMPKMSYSVMLYKIKSPLYVEGFESEEEIGDLDREIESCSLPYEFCFAEGLENTVADALKYLAYYSCMPDDDRKDFAEETITCLSEAICTGMKNKKDSCNPEEVIRRINNLNKKEDGIYQWIWSFAKKYSDVLEYNASDIKRNRHNYLKTCAVNYLTEYNAGIMPGFMDYDYEE